MRTTTYKKICTPQLKSGAILHTHPDFEADYLVLHCLLKRNKSCIKKFLEIGCNMGTGTKIIKNALGADSEVFSLDLPTELAHTSLQHPISEGKGDKVGKRCDLPFTLLRGDSLIYCYRHHYPIDGWFIDGEHDYKHPHHETLHAIESGAKLIVWHDSDMELVNFAIRDAMHWAKNYELWRVKDTRIAYAVKTREVKY